ncbi:TPA: cell division protein FtsI [Legionella pneumophila subsp. pneumophila]|uniref:M56 family metallopeptidase n=1 Tax=Legionella sp. PATHC039 TaxID=2992042 RepID=UPI001A32EB7C|nr:M56 family metallopeptidase [Legionella sp. PATHC039]HAT8857284.1 cell division protein FtsI [Legionella pneumophila subsp. pneumophila]MCW8394911.1 penicillin-binding transpeptidase domain-containing protein [Legionella sp. PATHC039]HAT8860357.1 cell division protein FtsI [Legionella pneumophila subsp. pneumophila]HAT9651879.1 cell division protein FtsI [Legionella pneumophila subsp. pneumophila]HAT9921042.1 cell division protein FtsI [Legionella pneumophila subsp. pneumophila]
MLLIEILLSIHCLLLISSLFIGRHWLADRPSFKLKLVRFLLVSCIISPLAVHCINPDQKPERLNYASFDALQEYVKQPIFKEEPSKLNHESLSSFTLINISYFQLFCVVFCLLVLFRGYHLLSGLSHLKLMLTEAILYRTSGKLIIKVSHRCHVPFSVLLFNKAYIVLPVSLLSSSRNVRIAIAHEGQHHRNGDCLWAYFIEIIRIIFFWNPGVTQWCRVLRDLQELSCDEVLVGHQKISAHDYGRCLFNVVKTVSQCSLSSNRKFACTVGMALGKQNEDCTFIIRRISMLSTYPPNSPKSLLLRIAFTGFSILMPICVAYSAAGTLSGTKAKVVDTSHLDPIMQNIAEREIAAAVKRYHAKSGVIAIANPNTGNIIAFAESSQNKEQNSWKSRVFSPGSTIKPFIAAAAIDSGNSYETKSYDCHSPYYIEDKTFTNYNPNVGSASLAEAIAKSINVCLIKVSQEAGAPVIRKKLSEFGFDMNSWWQADQSDDLQLAMASLGENIPVTIESLVQSYAILAHNGHQFDRGNRAIISETSTNSINHMLENAVTNGTGKLAAIPSVSVAGKTGTVIENNDKHLALFAGYVPADNPRYVVLVVIEQGYSRKNGETLTSGGELAAPVFRNVAMDALGSTNR